MATDFLVHKKGDLVGVVVIEDAKAGKKLNGWLMETGETITIDAKDDIPLGHKVALENIENGATIIEYGHDIGRAVASINKGRYVHAHNIKTKRW